MPEQDFYTTAIYRKKRSIQKLDWLYHKGEVVSVRIEGRVLKVISNHDDSKILEVKISDIGTVTQKRGTVEVVINEETNVLDFHIDYLKKSVLNNPAPGRARELCGHLQTDK
jgi:hypothetical protein